MASKRYVMSYPTSVKVAAYLRDEAGLEGMLKTQDDRQAFRRAAKSGSDGAIANLKTRVGNDALFERTEVVYSVHVRTEGSDATTAIARFIVRLKGSQLDLLAIAHAVGLEMRGMSPA